MKLKSRKRLINIYELRLLPRAELTSNPGEFVSQGRAQAVLNRLLRERDGGICAACGFDCDALFEAVLWFHLKRSDEMVTPAELCRAIGARARTWPRRFWQGDHAVPVCQGGPTNLENLQTLCLICHAKKSVQDRKPRTFGKRGGA